MSVNNPLANFSAATLIETRKRLDVERHNEDVRDQANLIRDLLRRADLSLGYVTLPLWWKPYCLYRENYDHLIANGYRVWAVDETRADCTCMSYHITWDCDDFRPKYEDYIAFNRLHGNHILRSSYRAALRPVRVTPPPP